MDNEQPHQELVKCVVVGDTAVGKTRLICARACNARVTLSQLMTTHIPTVWAIDQYRIYKEVLERSWEVVDGVSVSLRLWDTFGDHDKDRRFAYGRSDVVLLCFSIANPVSLRNCKVVWYPEIRRFCPNTPIVLVGCKNDLRYMYRDEQFLSLCRDRSPFFRANHLCSRFPEFGRPLRESDILTPEQGRIVAKEIGAPYYEASVLTHYGVNEVFENVIRSALIARRQQRFWITNLKHVKQPLLQVPFCPPKPPSPEITIPSSQFEEHLLSLLESQAYTDVLFVTGRSGVSGHRAVLAAVCSSFYKLFTVDLSADLVSWGRSASDSSVASSVDTAAGIFNADTEQLINDNSNSSHGSYQLPRPLQNYQSCSSNNVNCSLVGVASVTNSLIRRRTSCQIHPENNSSVHIGPTMSPPLGSKPTIQRTLQHPAFQSISVEHCDSLNCQESSSAMQIIVTLSRLITPTALRQCLRFLYTGSIDPKVCNLLEVHEAAELIEIPELQLYVSNMQHLEDFLNPELQQKFIQKVKRNLREMCLEQGIFSDVIFQLDDGTCSAHRPILMARCEMMAAMFRGDFRESSAKVVPFPGVSRECFHQLLCYLYTDDVDSSVNASNCLALLELANRLCLPRLVALIEQHIISELNKAQENDTDITEHALKLLEPCQMHNADQLADWCLYQISIHYNDVCHKTPKLLRSLHPENQAYLNRNRWPPVWYLKEFDYYERCVRERQWQEKPPKGLKRHRNNVASGCLCFSGKSRRDESKNAYRTV